MEIGSMNSMAGLMGMQGGMMQGMQRPSDPSEASSKFVDAMDSDGDGVLSETEFSVDGESSESSEVFDVLDTNEDGFVSQEELEADMQSKMDSMQARAQSGSFGGIQTGGDSKTFQQLLDMIGSGADQDQPQGVEQYARMQESMPGGETFQTPASAGLSIRT